jgi:dipeptide/tripeptide permease
VEGQRLAAIAKGDNISVMTQILQYALVGASEVLASIGQLEFFYDQVSPPSCTGSCMHFVLEATFLVLEL